MDRAVPARFPVGLSRCGHRDPPASKRPRLLPNHTRRARVQGLPRNKVTGGIKRFEIFCSRGTVCREAVFSSAETPTLQLNAAAPSPAPGRQEGRFRRSQTRRYKNKTRAKSCAPGTDQSRSGTSENQPMEPTRPRTSPVDGLRTPETATVARVSGLLLLTM